MKQARIHLSTFTFKLRERQEFPGLLEVLAVLRHDPRLIFKEDEHKEQQKRIEAPKEDDPA
jgi:hypothetical protein